jgi:hypothetical protein
VPQIAQTPPSIFSAHARRSDWRFRKYSAVEIFALIPRSIAPLDSLLVLSLRLVDVLGSAPSRGPDLGLAGYKSAMRLAPTSVLEAPTRLERA